MLTNSIINYLSLSFIYHTLPSESDRNEHESQQIEKEINEEIRKNLRNGIYLTAILFSVSIVSLIVSVFIPKLPRMFGAALLALSVISGLMAIIRFGFAKFSEAAIIETDDENDEE